MHVRVCVKGWLSWLLLKVDYSNYKPSGEVDIAEITPCVSCEPTNTLIAGVNPLYDELLIQRSVPLFKYFFNRQRLENRGCV